MVVLELVMNKDLQTLWLKLRTSVIGILVNDCITDD